MIRALFGTYVNATIKEREAGKEEAAVWVCTLNWSSHRRKRELYTS